MALVTCPDCGAQLSDASPACPHCGRPAPGGHAAPPPPRKPSTSPVVIVVVVMAVLFGGVVLLGILAAVAIPRFAAASQAARYEVATSALKQLHTLQEVHRLQNGAYTANLTDRESADYLAGYEAPEAHHFELSVPVATDADLCIEAVPVGEESGLQARSMDEERTLYAGSGCSGPVLSTGGE